MSEGPSLAPALAAGGRAGALLRATDWSRSPLGPMKGWPQSLQTALGICLSSRYPMAIWWGPEIIQLYNDAYIPVLGDKHPRSMGQRGSECWAEIWDVVGPLYEQVRSRGEPTWSTDLLLLMNRYGYVEETYFTFSYSPVWNESGGVGGILITCAETTEQVVGARRLQTLRALGGRVSATGGVVEACLAAAEIIRANPHDIPFAALYTLRPGDGALELAATTGLEPGCAAAPHRILESQRGDPRGWPMAEALAGGVPVVVEDLAARFGDLSGGAWPEAPRAGVLLPVAGVASEEPSGLLAVGISPRRVLDDGYRGFFDLLARQLASLIANAQAFEAERRRAEALAALDRAKTAFFNNVSHEFRTPLTLMLGPLEELLARADIAEDARGQAAVAHRNSLRLLKLVNSLLDFSRLEEGRVAARPERTDLAAFTAELASGFRAAIEGAGLRLVLDLPSAPLPAEVDRDMWERIVLNLLSNAFKFTFAGEIGVALRARDDRVELEVRDTGIGIPADEVSRIFDRFHRVEQARGRTHEGTGIGLALVQEMARLHQGEVRVVSTPGEGSRFTVSLPRRVAPGLLPEPGEARRLSPARGLSGQLVDEAMRWKVEEIAPGPLAGADRPRVLVADDNADLRDYVRRLLSQRYEVETVADGTAALQAARRTPPDLILSDVMMPGLDGFALIAALRTDARLRDIPVVLLSARAGEESRIEGLEGGADDYLVKPFSARELMARVRTHLELARSRRSEAARESELRRATERTLRELELILSGIRDHIVVYDRSWRYVYVNDQACELLGRPRGELLGRCIWDLYPEAVGNEYHRALERSSRQRTVVRLEHYYAPWDHWFDNHIYPLDDGIAVFATDITERRRADERMRQSESRYRALVEASAQVVWRLDARGGGGDLTAIRAWWEALTGQPLAEQAGLGWLAAVHPADRAAVERAWTEAFSTGTPLETEFRLPTRDGTERHLAMRGVPIRQTGGEVEEWIGMVQDLTERRRAEAASRIHEERLKLAWEATEDGFWDWNVVTGEVVYSPRWARMLGYDPAAIEGRLESWRRLLHPDDLPAVEQAVREHVEGRTPTFEAEVRLRAADGSWRWILSRGKVVERDAAGRPLRMVGGHSDMSERKALEERLRQVAKMEAVGRLAGGLAHDFNNQLQALRGFASLAAHDAGLSAAARQDLHEIQKAAERMASLTQQLLAFSRQQVLTPETLDLNAVVLDTEPMLRRLIGSSILFQVDVHPDPVWISADRAQLLQVLLNLSINARDAMSRGGSLQLRARSRRLPEPGEALSVPGAPPGDYAELTVEDSGDGIPPEHLPYIFEPFYTTKEVGGGTGLGLATVHGIVSQSRGYIGVRTELGRGTTFTVLLPLAEPPVALPGPPGDVRADLVERMRLLVVEDEEPVRRILVRALEAEGYEVVEARHGGEARDVLERDAGGVRLVLSDVVMPNLGGMELAEYLAERHPDLPIVWISGYPRETALPGGRLGADQPFLQKPVSLDVLAETLRRVLAGRGDRASAEL